MPKYDFICAEQHVQADQIVPVGTRPVCPVCGGATEILWQRSFPNIIRDEIPGGMTITNMSAKPETFYSHSEHKRRCKELGIVPHDEHVGVPGSDKSPHTRRWV